MRPAAWRAATVAFLAAAGLGLVLVGPIRRDRGGRSFPTSTSSVSPLTSSGRPGQRRLASGGWWARSRRMRLSPQGPGARPSCASPMNCVGFFFGFCVPAIVSACATLCWVQ